MLFPDDGTFTFVDPIEGKLDRSVSVCGGYFKITVRRWLCDDCGADFSTSTYYASKPSRRILPGTSNCEGENPSMADISSYAVHVQHRLSSSFRVRLPQLNRL